MELLTIFVVALLVIGPDKLPRYARKFGNAMRKFRKASSDVTREIRESMIDPMEEAQKPLREALEPLEEMDKDLRQNIKGVGSFKDGTPIEGLYATGDCTGGFFANKYPNLFTGLACGRTMTFGRRAAKIVSKL